MHKIMVSYRACSGVGVQSPIQKLYNSILIELSFFEIKENVVGLGRAKRIDMRIHKQDKRFSAGMLFSMAKPKVVGRKVNDGRVIPDKGQVGDE